MAYTTINKPSNYFDTQLFTGTNTSGRTFTGLNFQPDMIWGKQRDSASYNHFIVDVVRGGTKFIATNTTAAEDTASHGQITSWNSDGTTWSDGTNGTYPRLYYNDNGQLGGSGTRVWWQWKANGAGVSNNSGSITSTVSANTTSGFSIVSYTDSASTYTVGHGLGVAPSMIILKDRSTTYNWDVGHKSIGWGNRLKLNDTSATSSGYWNNTAPTSSVFTYIGNGTGGIIAYCFAEVKGFSKFGSYTGNGSTDGTFVYTGFKPAFVMVKVTDITNSWFILDNKRLGYNPTELFLNPNSSSAESGSTGAYVDFTSNGFKWRTTSNAFNGSSNNYIYAAFAEQPLVGTNNVPATAR